MKNRALAGISITIIALLTLSDLGTLSQGIDCIFQLNDTTAFRAFWIRLCAGNFLFKLIGIILAAIGLIEMLRGSAKLNWKLKILLVYTAIALILALPIYHRHPGFIGPGKHGHSFWNGGSHLH